MNGCERRLALVHGAVARTDPDLTAHGCYVGQGGALVLLAILDRVGVARVGLSDQEVELSCRRVERDIGVFTPAIGVRHSEQEAISRPARRWIYRTVPGVHAPTGVAGIVAMIVYAQRCGRHVTRCERAGYLGNGRLTRPRDSAAAGCH